MRYARITSVFLAVTLLCGFASAQCGQGGVFGIPDLSITSDLWESPFELRVQGAAPGAPLLLLLDTVPGPTTFPFGTLCTGPQPTLIADSFSLTAPFIDAGGGAVIPGAFRPPSFFLIGVPLYLQAAIIDFSAPSSVAISNGLTLALRAPRVFVNEVQCGASTSVVIRDSLSLAGLISPPVPETILPPVQPPVAFGNSLFAVSRDGARLLVQSFGNVPNLQITLSLYDVSTSPAMLVGSNTIPVASGGGIADVQPVFAPDGDNAFINRLGGVIACVDTDPASPTFLAVTNQSQPIALPPTSLVSSNDGSLLFVQSVGLAAPFTEMITALSGAVLNVVATLPVTRSQANPGNGTTFPQLALSPDGALLASLRPGAATLPLPADVAIFDAANIFQLATVPLGPGTLQVRGFVFDPADSLNTSLLYVENNGVAQLTRFDWSSGTAARTSLPAGSASTAYVSTTENGGFIFVATESGAPPSIHTYSPSLNLIGSVNTTGDGIGRIFVERR